MSVAYVIKLTRIILNLLIHMTHGVYLPYILSIKELIEVSMLATIISLESYAFNVI